MATNFQEKMKKEEGKVRLSILKVRRTNGETRSQRISVNRRRRWKDEKVATNFQEKKREKEERKVRLSILEVR